MIETISIVVPTLNESARLDALFDSIFGGGKSAANVGDSLEVLIVDGGSSDGTPEIAQRRGVRVLSTVPGRGVQLARGAAATRGELLVFLHADARLRAGSLDAIRDAFRDPALEACGLRQCITNDARVYRWIERAADARVRRGLVYGDSGLCVRRSAYDAVGGFRELPIFEDLDLSRRLRRRGAVRLVESAQIEISARRWERDGAVRRSVCNWILTAAYLAGVAPERLKRYYRAEPAVAANRADERAAERVTAP